MIRQSIRLARVAGIDIGAHWSVLVIAALLGYGLYAEILPAGAPGRSAVAYATAALLVSVLFLAGLLVHELAHALVARHYRIGVRAVTLWLLGGVSELQDEAPTPRAELLIAGAGPMSSLALGGLAAAATAAADAAGADRLLVICLAWLAGVNVVLGVFNLLPGAPLDGGRVVRALVWRVRGDKDAAQIAADRAGVVLGMLIGAAGLFEILFTGDLSGLWLVLLAWFLISAATAETAEVRLHSALDGLTVGDVMSPEPVCGFAGQSVDAFVASTAAPSRYRLFPVVDLDHRLVGAVGLGRLAALAPAARGAARLRDVALPASAMPVLSPRDPAIDAARALSSLRPLGAVVEDGRLVGVFTSGDLARAGELAALLPAGGAAVHQETQS